MIRFSTTGIRGIVGTELDPTLALVAGIAAARFFRGTIALGRDARIHSSSIYHAVLSGVLYGGEDVISLGYAPTPTVQYFVKQRGLSGGLVITASHNPPEYNGIKFVERGGRDLNKESEKLIAELIKDSFDYKTSRTRIGEAYEDLEATKIHIEGIIKDAERIVEAERIYKKIVVDPANSVSTLVTPKLLQKAGGRAITIHGDLNGYFPGRDPEPIPENLEALRRAVISYKADLGVAHDGDGDRAVFVDERGVVYHGDDSLAAIVAFMLPRLSSKKVVVSISTSNVVKDVVESLGGELYRAPVGARKVCDEMLRVGAEIGGEESGGIIYAKHGYFRDGSFAAYLFAAMLEEEDKKASEIFSSLPKYYRVKIKVPCEHEKKEKVMESIVSKRSDRGEAITIDGIRVRLEDGSRILIRPSGTEPIIRIFAESKNKSVAERLVEEARNEILELLKRF